ncbi:stage V sporulation protein AA [Alkalihalobacillus oceani]|nr:stage V sporulation protein AA [Halalkalibacter oceani]MCM3760299.1 stage V sporulation protein AA [Halalkalibacter oceani]
MEVIRVAQEELYLRLKPRISATCNQVLVLRDIAHMNAAETRQAALAGLPLYSISPEDQSHLIIDIIDVIKKIHEVFPHLSIQAVGAPQTLVEIKQAKSALAPVYVMLVWFLLFIGAGLAIMNFHEDVSMRAVHLRIFQLVTGNEEAKPLLLQIPYSIGLGLGMVLFFNHFFRKRLNEEPSPLEVEMFQYQQSLDAYLLHHENKQGKDNGH